MPDTDAAIQWLTSWAPAGPWLIGTADPSGKTGAFSAKVLHTVDALRAFIAPRNGSLNLYFFPHEFDPTVTTTPRKDQTKRLVALYIDLDLPKSGPYSAPVQENFERLLNKISYLNPPPTAIIFSGGGYQAVWLFPLPLPAAEHSERFESLGKALAVEMQSDTVQNINRWLRLPGTLNIPNETKRRRGRTEATEAYVVEAYWDRRWDYLTDPVPTLPSDYDVFVEPERSESTFSENFSSNRSIADLPTKWSKLIKSGDATDYRGDRSSLVFAFCCYAVRRDWSEGEITSVLLSPDYKISDHVLAQSSPASYAARQVARARKLVAEDWDYTAQGQLSAGSPSNVQRALSEMGIKFSHDLFAERSYVNGVGPFRELSDDIESEIRIQIHRRFKFYPVHAVQTDLVTTLARENPFHPVLNYLDSLRHDGVQRIDTWMIDHLGAEDTPYTRAVSRLILVAAVRRIRQPGVKFDHMVVLMSPQGRGKSSALAALCPNPAWFTDSMPLRLTDQKAIEHLAGKWIVECSELQGIRNSEVETVKAFISRQEDRARLAYGRRPICYARRCVLFGTTNAEVFLRDTENRRFLIIRVRTEEIDVSAISAARDQLWAEAVMVESEMPKTWDALALPREHWGVAAQHQESVREGDPWRESLIAALGSYEEGKIPSIDVWNLLSVPTDRRNPAMGARLTEVMKELGWIRSYQHFAGQGLRCFIRGSGSPRYLPILVAQRDDSFGPWRVVQAPEPGDVFQETRPNYDDLPF